MVTTSRSPSPAKRAREENDTDSDSDSDDSEDEGREEDDDNAMDFQHTEHVTSMQAIEGDKDEPISTAPQMAAPLSPEHTALRADIEIITSNLLDQFTRTISAEISVLFTQNNTTFQITTNSLTKQIATLGTRVTQMQQQLLSAAQGPATTAKPTGAQATPAPTQRKKGRERGREPLRTNTTPTALRPTMAPAPTHTLMPPKHPPPNHTHQPNTPHTPPTLKDGRT